MSSNFHFNTGHSSPASVSLPNQLSSASAGSSSSEWSSSSEGSSSESSVSHRRNQTNGRSYRSRFSNLRHKQAMIDWCEETSIASLSQRKLLKEKLPPDLYKQLQKTEQYKSEIKNCVTDVKQQAAAHELDLYINQDTAKDGAHSWQDIPQEFIKNLKGAISEIDSYPGLTHRVVREEYRPHTLSSLQKAAENRELYITPFFTATSKAGSILETLESNDGDWELYSGKLQMHFLSQNNGDLTKAYHYLNDIQGPYSGLPGYVAREQEVLIPPDTPFHISRFYHTSRNDQMHVFLYQDGIPSHKAEKIFTDSEELLRNADGISPGPFSQMWDFLELHNHTNPTSIQKKHTEIS